MKTMIQHSLYTVFYAVSAIFVFDFAIRFGVYLIEMYEKPALNFVNATLNHAGKTHEYNRYYPNIEACKNIAYFIAVLALTSGVALTLAFQEGMACFQKWRLRKIKSPL
jgi:hypothetical protein